MLIYNINIIINASKNYLYIKKKIVNNRFAIIFIFLINML